MEKSTKKGRSAEINGTHGEVALAMWLRINRVYDMKRRDREEACIRWPWLLHVHSEIIFR